MDYILQLINSWDLGWNCTGSREFLFWNEDGDDNGAGQ